MAKIILGYKMSPACNFLGRDEGHAFTIFEKGTVRIKNLTFEGAVIKSKKITIPQSIIEDITKCLYEQKNLIENLPENIYNDSVDGAYHDFNFMGKKVSCLNISRHNLKEVSEAKIFVGEFACFSPPSAKMISQQENDVLKIFESAYNFLKDYGLKVYSWKNFYCEWQI